MPSDMSRYLCITTLALDISPLSSWVTLALDHPSMDAYALISLSSDGLPFQTEKWDLPQPVGRIVLIMATLWSITKDGHPAEIHELGV